MKTIAKATLPLFWFGVLLTSCSIVAPLPEITPTQTQQQTTATTTSTATLAQPIATAIFTSTAPPTQTAVPTLSAIDIAFWENTLPLSDKISATEYDLLPGTDPIHQDNIFVPEEARWPTTNASPVVWMPSPTPLVSDIEKLGYKWKKTDPKNQCDKLVTENNECKYQLYKGQKLLLETNTIYVQVSQVYRRSTKSGSTHAFVVSVHHDQDNFLIHNGDMVPWGPKKHGVEIRPILYQDDFLWATRRFNGQVEVQKSNGELLYTLQPRFNSIMIVPPYFREWNGHWMLETAGAVAVDGEDLNEKFGFEQIFQWSLVKDKPTYFFQRGPKFGISYGGQILALQYDDIAHGMCCSPAQNNPGIAYDSARFFGKLNGVWRYVVVKFK